MLKNYFKIAIRTLTKRKGFSLLNIFGLTIGMTACLLIFHYVSYEKSYDRFIPENIYRLRLDYYEGGALGWKSATVYPGISPALKGDYPEVESYCRLIDADFLMEHKAVRFNEEKGYFSDASFFDLFNIKLEGNPQTALDGPFKIALSSAMAKKYFGNENPVGKTIMIRHANRWLSSDRKGRPFEVTGVFDWPKNSHLDIEYLVSFSTRKVMLHDTANTVETLFDNYDFYSYLKLKPGSDVKKFEAHFPAFCEKYMSNEHEKSYNNHTELAIIPAHDIHLHSNYNQEAEVNGNWRAVLFLFLIAIFIIGIAWINYINLTTARSAERAKEVGVKKVIGALRSDLMKQFFTENVVLNILSLLISGILFFALQEPFDNFTGRSGTTGISLSPFYWLLFLGLFISGTLFSGLYPAFILSGFKPVKVLKGAFKNTDSGIYLRKGLTIFQFSISVILISGTLIVLRQLQFMREKDLGTDIRQTLVLHGTRSMQSKVFTGVYKVFKTEVLKLPAVKHVVASSHVPGQEIYWTNGAWRLDEGKRANDQTVYIMCIEPDFIPAYNMKLTAGRNFSKDFGTDIKSALLNENAVRLLGFTSPAEAVNRKIALGGTDTFKVIGVTTDFHQEGLQKAVNPMLITLWEGSQFISVKLDNNNMKETVGAIEKIWNNYFPNDPFSYFFLDDSYNAQYKADMLFGKVFGVFAFLAIFIACLGLLGLSAYNVLQRTKEIGVRKVLGASVQTILFLLSKDFIKLVLISLLIAIPAGWYIMNLWLQDFAYRISIEWWVFAVSGSAAVFIAMITIVMQARKAAMANPVKSLRTE